MVFDGTAKPTPVNSPVVDWMAVLIPITWPLMLIKGPPEFPGLIAASVCMTSGIENPLSCDGSKRPN